MEHPYTKLLEELDGSRLVRFQKDKGFIYTWNGKKRVEVLNMEGACVDFFGVPESSSAGDVDKEIEEYMAKEVV